MNYAGAIFMAGCSLADVFKSKAMFRTLRIARLFGVDVFLHWSVWPLLIFILGMSLLSGGMTELGKTFSTLMILFVSVLLHELGHSLAARSVKVRTKDIVLLPIGGIARLEGAPFLPQKELWIAIAGPLTNIAIVALAALVYPFSSIETITLSSLPSTAILNQIIVLNMILGISNLLPALPLDGGRVYRALFAMKRGYLAATQNAARLSRWVGYVMILVSPFTSWTFLLIGFGVFLLLGSTQELVLARLNAVRQGQRSPFGGWSSVFPEAASFSGNGDAAKQKAPTDTVDAVEVKHL